MPSMIKDEFLGRKITFSKGMFMIEGGDVVLNTLQYAANVGYRYNHDLCKDAISNVKKDAFVVYETKNIKESNDYKRPNDSAFHCTVLKTIVKSRENA